MAVHPSTSTTNWLFLLRSLPHLSLGVSLSITFSENVFPGLLGSLSSPAISSHRTLYFSSHPFPSLAFLISYHGQRRSSRRAEARQISGTDKKNGPRAAAPRQRDTRQPLPLLRTVLLDSSKEVGTPCFRGNE